MRLILLDSGPLGQLAHPRADRRFHDWIDRIAGSPSQLVIPGICDYEVRRELIRAGLELSVRLDRICLSTWFVPVSTRILRGAAYLWSEARRQGRPSAPDLALDGDVILAATAQMLIEDGHDVIVATTNVNHLGRFVSAARWDEMAP